MRDLRTLRELQTIRRHRVETAEKAVYDALTNVEAAKTRLQEAIDTLREYAGRLPTLIDALYAECINRTVGKEYVEHARQKELKLIAKRDEYQQDERQCEEKLAVAQENLMHARESLKKERLKYDGLEVLVKEEVKKENISLERRQNKLLDEFASNKHITNYHNL